MASPEGYKRNYQQEYATEDRARRQLRAMRNAARRQLAKEGKVHKGDGMDVNHINPLSKGGGNKRGNLNVVEDNKNASYARTKKGAMKARKSYPKGR